MGFKIRSSSKVEIMHGENRKKEHFYNQVIQHIKGAFYVCDAAGRIIFFNQASANLWGREPMQDDLWCGSLKLFGRDGTPISHDSSPMAMAIKEGKEIPAQEIIIERPDGIFRNVLAHPKPIFDEDGKIAGASNFLEDVTESKRLEEELREQNKSWEILNNIGKTISGELELGKVVQAITDAATKISGAQFGAFFYNVLDDNGESYTLYTLSGVPKDAFSKFPMPRNTEIFAPTFHGTGIIRSDDITEDPRYGKNKPYRGMPEGHLPVRSYLAVPVISRTGKVIGGLFFGHSQKGVFTQKSEDLMLAVSAQAAIAMDNSNLYEASKKHQEKLAKINLALNDKNDELQKINIDLDNFIYTASHDLKAPVSNIEGLLHYLLNAMKNGNPSKEEINTILQLMQTSINRFSKTINDLTTITKIQKDTEEEVAEKVDLYELIEDIKMINGDLIANSGARIILESDAIPEVSFSRKNLKSILYNLITNAIKYRSPERTPLIRIFTENIENYIVLNVQDNGLGLEESKQKKLFSMFKRFHDHVEGTGIGLYLVKRIITNAGGKIEVESRLNHGSTFKVYIKDI